ncbi:DoxX family protein [Phytoactinopolyspora halotolerans]|uniref:DoxX family protein n=1 Tax=Phytoactinopolyspora halotolerans TaxID=1981512 RepID=A0A6L9SDB5_9ACTN|nr:DoxX family protein [Phytoactinopolyspora halotolerans]NEE03097.1 DoxX family protein [Phytoactinopolyspora halotolerans]
MFRSPIVRDVALLLARVGVGAVFVAHGWQKLSDVGVDNVAAGFEQMDVPLATASAWFAALVELVGGAALMLGLVTPLAGLLLVVDMVGAYIFAHAGNGMFIDQGGAELVLALGAASLIFAGLGGGRLSLDHVIAPRLGLTKRATAGASSR